MTDQPRIVLLMGPSTYRSAAFSHAADHLGLTVFRGLDLPEELSDYWHVTLPLDFSDPDSAARCLVEFATKHPVHAILSVDDGATLIAARASAALGLPHNDPESALAARDKYVMRHALAAGGVPVPVFSHYRLDAQPGEISRATRFPVVVKSTRLNGSRGVMRV